jgi:hypothetical protein
VIVELRVPPEELELGTLAVDLVREGVHWFAGQGLAAVRASSSCLTARARRRRRKPALAPAHRIGNYIRGMVAGLVEAADGEHEVVAFGPSGPRGRERIALALDGLRSSCGCR